MKYIKMGGMSMRIFYLLCLLFLCFCHYSKAQNSFYNISLEKEIEKTEKAGLKEIGSAINYIPLETSDECLLKDIIKVAVTDSHIAVWDWDKVLLFDNNGRFITEIGKKGQGPEEYIQLCNFCFSLDGNKIYLLTADNGKCLEYDIKGAFLHSYQVNDKYANILPLNNELFVFHTPNSPPKLSSLQYSLFISDLHTVKQSYFNYHKMRNESRFALYSGSGSFYSFQGSIRFKEHGDHADTLFIVTEKELTPYAIFNLGGKLMPANIPVPANAIKPDNTFNYDIVFRPFEGRFFVRTIREDNDNFYFVLYDWRKLLYGYYNKRSSMVKMMGTEVFQNNIDGGLPFWPKLFYKDCLLDCVNAFEFREHVLNGNSEAMQKQYGKNYDDLVKLVRSLDDDSNPIIIMVKK